MVKDWKSRATIDSFRNIGATNHSNNDREFMDLYCTEPRAVVELLKRERFSKNIWECAAGLGHLSEKMKELGYDVLSTDITERSYTLDKVMDFLFFDNYEQTDRDIITNPPYRFANEFIRRGYSLLKTGRKMAYLLPIRYLSGKERKQIFINFPPKTIYVFSGRITCALSGDFDKIKGNAIDYAWFVWERTKMNRYRKTKVEWI